MALFTKPMHPAPHSAMPASDATAATLSRTPLAAPNTTAERAPASAAAATCSTSAPSGTPSSTRSTASSRSASVGTQGSSSMRSYRGLTRCIRAELRRASMIMRAPKLPARALAPTMATDVAPSIAPTAARRASPTELA